MEILFSVDSRHHGKGSIVFAWHPEGKCVASSGTSRVVQISDKKGELIDQIVPPSPSICTALEWDRNGETLAIVQAASSIIVFWNIKTKKTHYFDTGFKDLTFINWSKVSSKLAIGTSKGNLIIFNKLLNDKVTVPTRHKRKVTCGDWNLDDKLAFSSDDRQITICSSDGQVLDQVKLKCRPLSVTFGGKIAEKDSIVSVNMDGRTIFLYNLNARESAIELAFQSRYGSIISYRWFGDGYIIAGFSSGYVVIISTNMNEIGQEQYCAKFHNDQLRDLSYNPTFGLIATCGDFCFKIINMEDWKEIVSEIVDRDAGVLDHLAWTANGKTLSVSSRNGCLYNFRVKFADKQAQDNGESHSILALLLSPITPLSILATCAMVIWSFSGVVIIFCEVSLYELVRGILGSSESV